MHKRWITYLIGLMPLSFLSAQMWNGTDTLYGNEWIQYDQSYLKITLAEDGIYHIPADQLDGMLPANTQGSQLQLFYMGEEIPIHVSTDGLLQPEDYIEFFGRRNGGRLDSFLFQNPQNLLHPDYSFFTDTSSCFLSWNSSNTNLRFETIDNDLTNPPPKDSFFYHHLTTLFTSTVVKKSIKFGSVSVNQSYFLEPEGFSTGYPSSNQQTQTVTPEMPYLNGPAAEMTVRFACPEGDHQQLVRVNDIPYIQDDFSGNKARVHTFNLPASTLSDPLQVQFEGLSGNPDKQAVSTISLRYPHMFDLNGKNSFVFHIDASTQPKYLEIEGFDHGNVPPLLYDLTNSLRLIATLENNLVKILLPPSTEERQLVLVNPDTGIKTVSTLAPVDFVDYNQEDAAFILLYNQLLAIDAQGNNGVEDYVNYRQFEAPEPLSSISVDIQQLYDQFAYGIHRHPLSIRNFGHFVKKNWTNPQYLFIVGKGREYPAIRTPAAYQQNAGIHFFIPTFGTPASDNLLLSTNNSATPLFPVGRLAITSPDELRIYLQKVRDFESLKDELDQTIEGKQWMKRVIHMGGGITATEQSTIKNNLLDMKTIIENNRFGGQVTSYFKTSTEPIELSQAESLKDLINTGISIITFFGHSSPNTFDFNFDDPEGYDNFKKYFLLLSNGCYSGNCFTPTLSIGERFVSAEDRGAIAYWASSDYGFISALEKFGDTLYHHIGDASYGKSIGQQIRQAVEALDNNQILGERELAQQALLQGDPSVKVNPLPGPDYTIDPESVKFEPHLLNLQIDSFDFRFSAENIGFHLPDTTFLLSIEQELPSGERITLLEPRIEAPPFNRTLSFSLPILGEESIGENRLFLKVDAADEIEELPSGAEWNNELVINGEPGIPFRIVSNELIPIAPKEFSIVNTPEVELIAYTIDLFAPTTKYVVEIDTTEYFNSPLRQRQVLTQAGGLVKWSPTLNLQENTVYYWRVSPDSAAIGGYRWRSSSFIYLPGSSPGWNQSHYFQFAKNTLVDTKLPESNRRLEYIEDFIDLKFQNGFLIFPELIPRYYRGNITQASYFPWIGNSVPAGMYIAVFDTTSVAPLFNDGSLSYGDDYGYPGFRAFAFKTTSTDERAQVIDFLENVVEPGQYVGLFTVQRTPSSDYFPETWAADTINLGTSLFDVLEAQGAEMVRDLEDLGSLPYTLFYRKNRPDFPTQEIISYDGERTQLNVAVEGNWFEGSMFSTTIGPANNWETLSWEVSEVDNATDSLTLNLYAPVSENTDTLLIADIQEQELSLQDIDPDEFPFLKLQLFTHDPSNRTSPQLDFWRINYQGIPEAALNPALYFTIPSDTMLQGTPFILQVAVENISDLDMDSLLVHFTLTDAANSKELFEKRFRPLPGRDTLIATLSLDTRTMLGAYDLTISVNPEFEQPERTLANNVGAFSFHIIKDQRNPLLDITFDGVPIMEGDLVSASPRIMVSLNDENPYLELADTSLFQLLLVHPSGWEQPIYFAQENVRFFPADPDKLDKRNRATVEYSPSFQEDGVYQLFVKAGDATGNQSGDLNLVVSPDHFGFDEQISFQIITQSMISNVLNYPNPFSTRTKFVYTLTGSEPPAFFKIQILTVSGRIVRELTQTDLGPLRIGTHQTDFAWDGTDQFGDPLANGVYLYRVVARDATGQVMDNFSISADRFFKKGFGKLVIIR